MFALLYSLLFHSNSSLCRVKEAEKSLVYFRNVKKLTKFEHQQIGEELRKLQTTDDGEDDSKLTLKDLSKLKKCEHSP